MDRSILLALTAFSFLPSTVPAQTTPVPGKPLVVLSAPFTAQEQTTSSFQAAGGGTVSSFQRVDVARNTAGSTRREPRIASSPTAQPNGSVFVEIHDAVNRLAIHLNPSSLTATSNILLYSKTTLTAPTILWAAISASSLRAEQALHTVGSQLSSLEAANRQDCKVATVNCPAALQRSSQFALLRAQRQQAVDAEAASLESVLSVESTSRLRHYLQTDFASHVQSMTLTATQVKAAKAVQR